MPLDVQMPAGSAENSLNGLVRFLGNTADPNINRKPLDEWGEYMKVRTDLLFATGSRDGVNWKKLKPSTRESRRMRGIRHARILDVTGGIRRSIRAITVQSLDGLVSRVYSNHPRTKIHHRGAKIPARTLVPKNAQALRFSIGGQVVFARRADIPASEIPARPILFISDRDRSTAVRYIREHRLRLAREAVKKAKQRAA